MDYTRPVDGRDCGLWAVECGSDTGPSCAGHMVRPLEGACDSTTILACAAHMNIICWLRQLNSSLLYFREALQRNRPPSR